MKNKKNPLVVTGKEVTNFIANHTTSDVKNALKSMKLVKAQKEEMGELHKRIKQLEIDLDCEKVSSKNELSNCREAYEKRLKNLVAEHNQKLDELKDYRQDVSTLIVHSSGQMRQLDNVIDAIEAVVEASIKSTVTGKENAVLAYEKALTDLLTKYMGFTVSPLPELASEKHRMKEEMQARSRMLRGTHPFFPPAFRVFDHCLDEEIIRKIRNKEQLSSKTKSEDKDAPI